jgi:hypothetical protein
MKGMLHLCVLFIFHYASSLGGDGGSRIKSGRFSQIGFYLRFSEVEEKGKTI